MHVRVSALLWFTCISEQIKLSHRIWVITCHIKEDIGYSYNFMHMCYTTYDLQQSHIKLGGLKASEVRQSMIYGSSDEEEDEDHKAYDEQVNFTVAMYSNL